MKPFNLKEALEKKPVVTRNGLKLVSIFYDSGSFPETRIIGRLEGRNTYDYWREDGCNSSSPSALDLFMATTKREAWVNVYNWEVTGPYETKEKADRYATESRIACCRIEWEE